MTKRQPQQSPDFPDAFYRVSVKGLIVQDDKLLLVDDFVEPEKNPNGKWELPGGGLDFGEEPRTALVREIKEEMGLEATWVSEKPVYIWPVRHEDSRGLDWYYVLVLAYHVKVRDLNFTPTTECRKIQFFSKEDLLNKDNNIAIQVRPVAELFNPNDFK